MPKVAEANTTEASTTHAAERPKIEELGEKEVAAAMRAFFNITSAWKVTSDEERRLLGSPKQATFYNWKNGKVGVVPVDTIRRISYVLGIYKSLHIIHGKPELADGWVQKANDVFNGQSALQRMAAGDLVDLAAVREYLDVVRGGWQ